LIINIGHFLKHDYYFQRVSVLLNSIYQLNFQHDINYVKINGTDGLPVKFCGLVVIIDQIRDILPNIDSSCIEVITNDPDFKHPDIRITYQPSGFFEKVQIKNISEVHSDAKLFGAVYGRFSLERFLLAAFIGNKFSEDSFIIFQPDRSWIDFELSGFESLYAAEIAWYHQYKICEPEKLPSHHSKVQENKVMDDYDRIYPKYLIEVAAETNVYNSHWFTEKTIKCLLSKKPFILLSGMHALKNLRDMGFKTFNPVFNESYDEISEVNLRLSEIKKELLRIFNLSPLHKKELFSELEKICQYNLENYNDIAECYYKRHGGMKYRRKSLTFLQQNS
jgi:hypothetical protein